MEFRFNYSIYIDCPLKAGDLNDLYICINNQKGFTDPDRAEVDPIIMIMKNLKPVSDINWSILKDEKIIVKGMTNSGGASKIPILKKDNYLLRVFI